MSLPSGAGPNIGEEDLGMIKYKGVFDLQGLVRMMRKWIIDKGYDFFETTHKAKIPELELKWHGEKKVTGYYKYYISVDFHFWDLRNVEVDVNGEKKKMVDGRFHIVFECGIERGYAKNWDEEDNTRLPFLEQMRKIYDNFLTKREFMAEHADYLINETRQLMQKTKAFLGMEGV